MVAKAARAWVYGHDGASLKDANKNKSDPRTQRPTGLEFLYVNVTILYITCTIAI